MDVDDPAEPSVESGSDSQDDGADSAVDDDGRQRLLILSGAVALTALVALAPADGSLSTEGQYALATMAFAAVLWITGALPLSLTALTVPILLTVFGVYPRLREPLAAFADPVVFLLFAGFALAAALQSHGVDRRLALALVSRVGTSPRRIVLAVMVATAGLSMVISNTATTAMMVPIALGVVGQVTGERPAPTPDGRPAPGPVEELGQSSGDAGSSEDATSPSNMQVATLLGTAYAATVGGVGTLIGTPPNAIVAGQLESYLGVSVTFLDWLFVGLPLVAVALPLTWYLLTYRLYPPDAWDVSTAREAAESRLAAAGELSTAARRTVAIFGVTAALWLLGGFESLFERVLSPAAFATLFGGSGPTVFGTVGHQGLLYYVLVGLVAVVALVATGAAAWDDLLGIDWGTLLLLGGGLSLADGLRDSGAIDWLATEGIAALGSVPVVVLVLAVVGSTVLLGELASNTAMAAILAPLLITAGPAYAAQLGTGGELASVFLAVTVAVAASFGFALPVATPPNAIVYGSGAIGREHMLRAGVVLDLVMILLVTAAAFVGLAVVLPFVFG
ncbi:SLC13 family permease [Halosimplex amylolyticum]|uniref:SLC13 family permease n=1 Tax=Halosimplex amylolyticum TaxID=3396616 RepID=UPI003F552A6E